MPREVGFIIWMELEMTLVLRKSNPCPDATFIVFFSSVAVRDEILQETEMIRLQADRFLKRTNCLGWLADIPIEKSESEMTIRILRIFPDEFSCRLLGFGKLAPVHIDPREGLIDSD